MSISYRKRILPRDAKEQIFLGIMIFIIPVLTLWELFIVVPHYHGTWSLIVVIHFVLAIFIAINLSSNMFCVLRVDPSSLEKPLPSILMPGWQYCYDCQLNYPTRTYHCYTCNECVVKRDHHCGFTGCCVGYHNQRFYFIGVIYLFIGAIYGAMYQMDFCFTMMGGFSLGTSLCLIAPHFALLFGYLSLHGFVAAMTQVVWFVVCIFSTYLLYAQVITIYRGQTQFERQHNIRNYDLKWRKNFKYVLGQRWYLTWLSPFINSPLPGDGLEFSASTEFEDVKNI